MLNKKLWSLIRFRTYLLTYLICLVSFQVHSLDVHEYLRENAHKNQNDFLESFPYKQFLKENGFGNYDSLQEYKIKLDKIGLSGDKFLYKLTQNFLNLNPISYSDLPSFSARFNLAEYFIKQNTSDEMIFEIVSNMLMEDLSQQLNNGLSTHKIPKKSPELKSLVNKLSDYQFIVDIPMSKMEKLQYHIYQGNWMYILDRVCKEYFWGSYWLFGMVIGLVCIISSLMLQKMKRWSYKLPSLFQQHS